MTIKLIRIFLALALVAVAASCGPDLEPETGKNPPSTTDPGTDPEPPGSGDVGNIPSYDNLAAYKSLKSYIDRNAAPDFKLGVAVTVSEFLKKTKEYSMAVENFDEMTAGNAMKQSSILRSDGSMNFTQVRNFLNAAQQAGMTVYGHTLAWHSQQSNEYLRGLVSSKKVPVEPGTGEEILLTADFDDGTYPFNSWGNNSTRGVEDGAFKVSNPSVVKDYEAQFAADFTEPFVNGQKYLLSFKVKGSSAGGLLPGFQIVKGYHPAGQFPKVNFDTEWQTVQIEASCTAAGATRLVFSFGDFAGDIYVDDFTFKAVGLDYTVTSMNAAEKKEALTDAMDRWIKAVMQETATQVSAWDAVNETISGHDLDGDGFFDLESAQWGSADNFYWQDYLGSEDYVRIVISKARKYYEECGGTTPLRLFINDYNLESFWDDNKKLRSLIHWIGIWESDGATKIDGIGTQMHISYYEDPNTQKSNEEHVVKMLQLMAGTGKLVKISELDMGYINKSGQTLKTQNLTDSQHRKMADFYEFIVRKYFEIVPRAQQYGITQWCPTDSPSGSFWRAGEPTGLWNQHYNRKYAYAGFANALIASF